MPFLALSMNFSDDDTDDDVCTFGRDDWRSARNAECRWRDDAEEWGLGAVSGLDEAEAVADEAVDEDEDEAEADAVCGREGPRHCLRRRAEMPAALLVVESWRTSCKLYSSARSCAD